MNQFAMIYTMSKEPRTIGELLKNVHVERIQEIGSVISQRELADWFGIDPIIFNKYYNDQRVPESENLDKIAAKVGLVAYKLANQVPPEIKEQIDQVPPENLEELKTYISEFLERLIQNRR